MRAGDLERGCGGLLESFVTLCGRIGNGRVIVVSSGEDGIETMDDVRRRIVTGELAEDLLEVKDVMRGKGGRFGAEGVVGVSTGDCGCSCILMSAFVFD